MATGYIIYMSFSCNIVVLRLHLTSIVPTPFFSKPLFSVFIKILEIGSVQFPSEYKPSRADLVPGKSGEAAILEWRLKY